jgi:AI-2 transport protein TqsA
LDTPQQERRVQTICLLILSGIGIAFALYFLKPVLIPFVLAVFLAIGLRPVVEVQVRRLRLPHALAVISTLVLGVAILAALGLLVSISVGELAANSDEYVRQTDRLIRWAGEHLRMGPNQPPGGAETRPFARMVLPGEQVRSIIFSISTAVMNLASNGMLVLICLCFLLFGDAGPRRRTTGVWREIVRGIREYIVTKVLISAVTGVLVGLTLWVLGIKLALVFGLMAFLLNFIPNIGSIVATLLPLPVVLLAPDVSTPRAVLAIALPGAVQFFVGNVLEPRVMGKSFDLHPIAILLALIFWGVLWGIVGMFLAVPLTAALKVLFMRHPYTAPLAGVLAGHVVDEEATAGPPGKQRAKASRKKHDEEEDT